MASLKQLRTRIKSVKSTQKITKAMKMVAASKLRRAQDRAEAARPYSDRIESVIANLAKSADPVNAPALLIGRKNADGSQKEDRVLLIVTSSDRGLCGGFNSTIIRAAKKEIEALKAQGKKVKIVTVGKKAREQLKHSHESLIIESFAAAKGKVVTFKEAEIVAKFAIDQFEKGEVDLVKIVYNKFVNPLVQKVTFQGLIPLDIKIEANENKSGKIESPYDYEPSEEAVLVNLLPTNISVQVFKAYLENSASEQGSRMTAMDSATKNAGAMINKLTLTYNRSRQATITKELIEIISGAEAV
jgi:F-type H+-transporting ATPase subunit gamma